MSQDEDKSQKTEDPTPKKLQDAREKGDVPSSKEVGTVMSVFILMSITVFVAPSVAVNLYDILGSALQHSGTIRIGEGTSGLEDVSSVLSVTIKNAITAVAPVFLLMVIASIFGVIIQGEVVVAVKRIEPKLENISLKKGVKRIFSSETLVEFLKSFIKVAVVVIIAYLIISSAMIEIWQTILFIPEKLPQFIANKAGQIMLTVSCLIIPLALLDVVWQRNKWIKKNKMSLKDVKDEHKDMEGDPQIKSKRDIRRRELSQKRMKDVIPKATVILTNPTHFSVALKWERGVDPAPVVIAKGVDQLAKKIRELAVESEVPIIENKKLARAIHATTNVDDVIPSQHWEAVAEILNFVTSLKDGTKINPPEGSTVRED